MATIVQGQRAPVDSGGIVKGLFDDFEAIMEKRREAEDIKTLSATQGDPVKLREAMGSMRSKRGKTVALGQLGQVPTRLEEAHAKYYEQGGAQGTLRPHMPEYWMNLGKSPDESRMLAEKSAMIYSGQEARAGTKRPEAPEKMIPLYWIDAEGQEHLARVPESKYNPYTEMLEKNKVRYRKDKEVKLDWIGPDGTMRSKFVPQSDYDQEAKTIVDEGGSLDTTVSGRKKTGSAGYLEQAQLYAKMGGLAVNAANIEEANKYMELHKEAFSRYQTELQKEEEAKKRPDTTQAPFAPPKYDPLAYEPAPGETPATDTDPIKRIPALIPRWGKLKPEQQSKINEWIQRGESESDIIEAVDQFLGFRQ